MTHSITLSPLARTSPSLDADIRLCGLRAAFRATPDASVWVLRDPRAWLGTAYHQTLSAVAAGSDPAAAWNASVTCIAAAAARHPFARRYAIAERWPSYFLIRQRALAASKDVAQSPSKSRPLAAPENTGASSGRERLFTARGGLLAGKPDHFDQLTITEYKSSLPAADSPHYQQTLEDYRRQLQLYAAILAEVTGTWRTSGRLVCASGQTIEWPLASTTCDAEADAAVTRFASLNSAMKLASNAASIAAPSFGSCARCPFQLVCPAFWRPMIQLNDMPAPIAAAGHVLAAESGNDGDLILHLALDACTRVVDQSQSIVIRRSIHGQQLSGCSGQRIRITRAWLRQDGRIQADIATLIAREDELPCIDLSSKICGSPEGK